MNEQTKLILSIVFLALSLVLLIIVFAYTKKDAKYRKIKIDELELESVNFYKDLKLKDDIYFPYYKEHCSGLIPSIKSKGDIDLLSKVEVKKGYKYNKDKIIYIINDSLHYDNKVVEIDNQEYIEINKDIKTIQVLISFEKPSHFIAKYRVESLNDGYKVELIEEEDK